ncbi:ATP-grasp domain-containing protein [Vibrio vulnificus]|nr:ATP-grasp domain-containing protein [Vibrio vulnificus]
MLSLVVLVHRGRSSFDQIDKECKKLGVNILLVSSSTGNEALDKELLERAHEAYFSTNDTLTYAEVSDCLKAFSSAGHKLIGCISVWEGYREIMAEINYMLKANDISVDLVRLLRDKYRLRKKLQKLGVSNVYCDVLSEDILEKAKLSVSEYYIKPRFGIASYGAFKVTQDTTWGSISCLKSEIFLDKAHNHCFGNLDFIIEDYLDGTEYSFEVFVDKKNTCTIAIHEKVEIRSAMHTTLESALISPPISLPLTEQLKATGWIESVFDAIGIETGCFHVEAKKTNRGWEIIEINPRIGGSYIPDSVYLTSKISLLSCWIRSLNTELYEGVLLQARRSELEQDSSNKETSAFFRIYYGKPGKKITDVNFIPKIEPIAQEFFFTVGDVYPTKSCEVFLGHCLWSLDSSETRRSTIEELTNNSESYLDVTYE